MRTITLTSGTYAVDPILDGFDIIEKPSSNVAFVGTDMLAGKMYVQFKNGSGYIYSEVDADTLSFVPIAESIGKFISSKVVKHFPSVKQENALIVKGEEIMGDPVLIITGDIKDFPAKSEAGIIFQMSEGATMEYIEPKSGNNDPEF
ncbi:KTSC domain-containing protein [Pedobacter metabolipauper]|nr:KTSC domain-containing protein [Pedobacter metabolipauper]